MMFMVPRLDAAQLDVVTLADPLPELERVPVPVQLESLERAEDSLIGSDTPGADELSCVPHTGTAPSASDPGV